MPPPAAAEPQRRPSYLVAGAVSAVIFGLYLRTLAPSTAMWDASEYIAAAHVLGLPHPPGNPFFVLLGHVFSILPIAPTVAMRINALAALCSALSAASWFLITERVLANWLPERWQQLVGASLSALLGATAFTVWNQSVVNEKVYMVSLAFFAIVSWLTVRWCDDPDGPAADRLLVLIAFLIALGYTNHPAGFLVAPAVIVAVAARRPRIFLRWRLVATAALAFGIGLTPFLYEPIRSAHFPPINEGEPTGCLTKLEASCTFTATTWERFKANVNREQYGKPSLDDRQAPFSAQIGMWWLYFKWQWLRDPTGHLPAIQTILAVLFLFLGLAGGFVHWQRDRRSFWFFGPLIFTITLALIFYLNFKYGYSQSPELGNTVNREVRDRDYFFLWSYSAWSVWAGLGLVLLWESVSELLGTEKVKVDGEAVDLPKRRSWLITSPILALALLPLVGNARAASRHGDTFTRDWAVDVLNSVEPYSILITNGDNDTFPLWYAQEVEGIRKDVIVAVTSLLNTDWYVRQMIRRPVWPYDAERGPVVYKGRTWPKPDGSPLKLTLAEADSIPPYLPLRDRQVFRKDSLIATIEPGVLSRDQLVVLRLIRDSFPERPLYFSSASYPAVLGLRDYVLTQGLASKLMPTPIVPGRGAIGIQGFGFLDVPRTDSLWTSVYTAPRSLLARQRWIDRASSDIPMRYVITGAVLNDALRADGDSVGAARVMAETIAIARAARVQEVLGLK